MFVGGNLVTWKSKRQLVVAHARSCVELEYEATTYGAHDVLWIRSSGHF